ncbi:hypothetical protein SV7mr_41570 [Stieleria bergensis]|uniref:Uncharacterized protein n=1 Tax=Stieleria bergensis TaxID=2528025 RepID=A0A517SZP3_9BACT|nr:hypothetical protein SV7mr_41570 [Planctomycetes bacterium SV_7m_r]
MRGDGRAISTTYSLLSMSKLPPSCQNGASRRILKDARVVTEVCLCQFTLPVERFVDPAGKGRSNPHHAEAFLVSHPLKALHLTLKKTISSPLKSENLLKNPSA